MESKDEGAAAGAGDSRTHHERETDRYMRAAHRVLTAIGFNPDQTQCEPKQLRVGVDMRAADARGLARLLIAKGLFTLDEYVTAVADAADLEAAEHEAILQAQFPGTKITTL